MKGLLTYPLVIAYAWATTCEPLNRYSLTTTLLEAFHNDAPLAIGVARQVFPTDSQSHVCYSDVEGRSPELSIVYPLYKNTRRRALMDPFATNQRNQDIMQMRSLLKQWKERVTASPPDKNVEFMLRMITDAIERTMLGRVCGSHPAVQAVVACRGFIGVAGTDYYAEFLH
eukprot:Protomagalhaensia_wolfi_Nauph_80__6093@NODE_864_length_1932_cov_10_260433_g651_i0_p2_GENE_NODE_864_length_1932_cov_10_260433_g651_i0NODE_864_length_1932_cov_10_260433_g651_i0_p2_ORF_typecomplete_len171_score16_29DUF305/PF03713_13/0_047_NODE_864_length_1932_cov_10_260433_g651_i02514